MPTQEDIVVRRAEERDLPAVARLAAELVRMHHSADPARFLLVEDVEAGYERWLGRELSHKDAIVLVASRAEAVAGYAYATLEGRDWNMLLDAHGALQDLFVAEEFRRSGIGRRLVEETVATLEARGARRIVLSTMVKNEPAQRLFQACGFRPTMLEMTR